MDTNKNFLTGVNYEYGAGVKRDYKKALEYYQIAADEGHQSALKKIKYRHFSIIQVLIIVVGIIIGLAVDLTARFPWLGIFIASSIALVSSILFAKRYWIRNGYAFVLNWITIVLTATITLPFSVIKPYIDGITWLPVLLLLVVAIFITISTVILFLVDKNKRFLIGTGLGAIMLVFAIISFSIITPEKKFIFRLVDDAIEITGYRHSDKDIVIPNKINGYEVVGISDYAFYNEDITSIVFNHNLKYIGSNALAKNPKLQEVIIPDGVTLGAGVFIDNFGLSKVQLPTDLKVINSKMFSNNRSLRYIEIPSGVEAIGFQAFANSAISSIELPKELKHLGDDVFANTKITELNLPESLITLGALSNMELLENFNIPQNITKLPNEFLLKNKAIEEIIVPNHILEIGDYAFQESNIKNVILHDEIMGLGIGIFYQNNGIREIVLPSNLTRIPKDTFSYSSIETIHIHQNIREIGQGAFIGTQKLSNVTIDSGLRTIEGGAFESTQSLNEIIIPNTVISIGINAFAKSTGLKKIVLPNSLNVIADGLFDGAQQLSEVNLNDNITIIGKASFRNTNLQHLVLPAELTKIGDHAFFGNKLLETIVFNNNLKEINTHSFGSNLKLKSLDLPLSLEVINDYAFNGCLSLVDVIIKENVKTVGYWAFKSNSTMTITIINNSFIDSWNHSWNPLEATVILI